MLKNNPIKKWAKDLDKSFSIDEKKLLKDIREQEAGVRK